jgi:hypothetical protein
MRQFLKSLASIFVVLGGIASVIGLLTFLLSIFADRSSVPVGIATTLSGAAIMLAPGTVYLLAEIAGALIDPNPNPPTLNTKPLTSLSIPPSARR